MGQIKNIKLHIVTDIKTYSRRSEINSFINMKLSLYNAIIKTLNNSRVRKKCWLKEQSENFSTVSEDTLLSIYSQYQQRKVKRNFHRHHRRDTTAKYYKSCVEAIERKEQGFLLKMSYNIDFPPTLLARIILEEYFRQTVFAETSVVPKGYVSKFIKNPTLIPHKQLQHEVELCCVEDDVCGPSVEAVKHEMGVKYERLLENILTQHDIPYNDEEVLRKEGYDKTPDFKLIIPIGVNNRVINWIESKASFGDEESHATYLENQFWSYTNRYGAGLVIYWFGFVEELNVNVEQGILLLDSFPSADVITLETLLDEEDEKFTLVD